MKKRLYASYVSKEVFDLVNFLADREEITKVVFVRKAIRKFMEGEQKIDPRILITQRTDPEYIERGALFSVQLEDCQREQLKDVAEEKGCKASHVFFQALLDYCVLVISEDGTGVDIVEKE